MRHTFVCTTVVGLLCLFATIAGLFFAVAKIVLVGNMVDSNKAIEFRNVFRLRWENTFAIEVSKDEVVEMSADCFGMTYGVSAYFLLIAVILNFLVVLYPVDGTILGISVACYGNACALNQSIVLYVVRVLNQPLLRMWDWGFGFITLFTVSLILFFIIVALFLRTMLVINSLPTAKHMGMGLSLGVVHSSCVIVFMSLFLDAARANNPMVPASMSPILTLQGGESKANLMRFLFYMAFLCTVTAGQTCYFRRCGRLIRQWSDLSGAFLNLAAGILFGMQAGYIAISFKSPLAPIGFSWGWSFVVLMVNAITLYMSTIFILIGMPTGPRAEENRLLRGYELEGLFTRL